MGPLPRPLANRDHLHCANTGELAGIAQEPLLGVVAKIAHK
jgi:hypothetical protein